MPKDDQDGGFTRNQKFAVTQSTDHIDTRRNERGGAEYMNRLQVPDDATRKHRTGATNSIGEPIEVGKRDVNSFGGEINII